MFWSVYSAKGGSGVSVLACALALEAAQDRSVLLIDWCGDAADILSVPDLPPEGVRDWCRADPSVDGEAVDQLARPVTDTLRLLGPGATDPTQPADAGRIAALSDAALRSASLVIVDLGAIPPAQISDQAVVASVSDRATLVVRACYLNLRRATRVPVEPTDVVEITEPGRSLKTVDIEGVLKRPVDLRIAEDPLVARAVDMGLSVSRAPWAIRRACRTLHRLDRTEAWR